MHNINKILLLAFGTLGLAFFSPKTNLVYAQTVQGLNLERQAEQLYQEHNYSQAISLMNKAIARYQQTGNTFDQVIAARNLALLYQKMGSWQQAKLTIAQTEELIATLDKQTAKNELFAQLLEVKGQVELSLGQPQQALATWKKATSLYQQQKKIAGFTQGKIYQAIALQSLGLYSQSIKTLSEVNSQLESQANTKTKAEALLKIGNALNRVGRYQVAKTNLESSLKVAQDLASQDSVNQNQETQELSAEILLGLGDNQRSQNQPELALDFYQRAISKTSNQDLVLRGKLNQLAVLIDQQALPSAQQKATEIEKLLTTLPPGQTTIQAQISLARNQIKLEQNSTQTSQLLVTAIKQSQALKISRTEAEALGVLGNLYERQQQWQEAQKTTERALIISQGINAKELSYQWQWQLGRIFLAQDESQQAIAAYTQATNNLQTLRSDLVSISSDIQYSFREKIEPVYRELAALLLQPGATQDQLNQARNLIESLQVAELDNFFRDACLDTQPQQVDRIDPQAAVFYTIILGDRLEVIAAIPGQSLVHYSNDLPPSEIDIVVTSANSQINSPRRLNLQFLQQTYDWLIRPVEADLEASNIETLVFVPDGILRNLPPATLHDGEQYLIEKYGVAIAPSLKLVELGSQDKTRQELLLAGLSQPRQGFSSLPGVKTEIEEIKPLFASEVLLNEGFTELNFNRSVSKTPFRVVHLATHGQFSSNAEDTFVLTWDDRINIDELNSLIRGDSKKLRPVDLLVLSACETAIGDQNSTLGLAGIAVRGGAQSTIASLWSVSDRATVALMTSLYKELAQTGVTKAEALRRAQVSILKTQKFSHPFFWSAFILVGNWQ